MANHIENKPYLAFVRTLTCVHCKNEPCEPHHVIGMGMGIMGGKSDDIHAVPMCRMCHDAVHRDYHSYPQAKWVLETQHKAQIAGEL